MQEILLLLWPSSLNGKIIAKNLNLQNTTKGSAVSVLGANDSYSLCVITWSPSGSHATKLSGLAGGTYTYSMACPGAGCNSTGSVTINNPGPLSVTLETPKAAACSSSCTGEVFAKVSGGTPVYRYTWNNSISQSPYVYPACPNISYSVTVVDAMGCTAQSAAITVPISTEQTGACCTNPMSATLTSTDATCADKGDGTLTAFINGGSTPYSYFWDNAAGTNVLTAKAGSHTVLVLDAENCMVTKSATISSPATLCCQGYTAAISTTNASCPKDCDGTLTVQTQNGVAPYTYTWVGAIPGNNNTPVVTGVCSAANYSVKVKDARGCEASAAHGVGVNTGVCPIVDGGSCEAFASSIKVENIVASPDKTQAKASLTISTANGVAPYTYNWFRYFNGPTAQGTATNISDATYTLANVLPGYYQVTVIDNKGCKATIGAILPGYNIENDPCKGSPINVSVLVSNEDNATPIVTGGTGTYAYLWTDLNGVALASKSTEANQINLPDGTYKLTVTSGDAKCKATAEVTVPDCGFTTFDATQSREASCPKNCDGEATLSLSPIGNASILWDGKTAGLTLLNACPGKHKVRIETSKGCVLEDSVVISSGTNCPQPVCDITIEERLPRVNKVCYNDRGAVDLVVKGGKAPFTYKWIYTIKGVTDTTYSDNEDLENPLPGTYSLYVTDVNKCTANFTVTVSGPTQMLAANITAPALLCAGGITDATLHISGGVSPYEIEWNNGKTSFVNSNISAGVYTADITDASGCTTSSEISVQAPLFKGRIYASQRLICNGEVSTLTASEVPGYAISWSGPMVSAGYSKPSLTTDTPGVYILTYNQHDCTSVKDTIIVKRKDSCNTKKIWCETFEFHDIPIDTTQSCIGQKVIAAQAYGSYRYKEYINEEKRQFKINYIEQIMASATETFKMEYTESENQYTLYYYDQAGNLVRTVMPSGVKTLDAAQATAAGVDIVNKTSTVFTDHTLATTYKYNSLNQLIAQDMPDHGKQDLWEPSSSDITLGGGNPAALAYGSTSAGVLLSNKGTYGEIFTSADAGVKWSKEENPGVGDIKDIQKVDAATVYAVGTAGTILKSIDGGSNWLLKSPPAHENFIKLFFSTANNGLVMSENGSIWKTANGGDDWSAGILTLKNSNIGTITDAWLDATGLWVSTNDNGKGRIFKSTDNGVSFNEDLAFTAGAFTSVSSDGTGYVAAGNMLGATFRLNAFGKIDATHNNLTTGVKTIVKNNSAYAVIDASDKLFIGNSSGTSFSEMTSASGVKGVENLNTSTFVVLGNDNKIALSGGSFYAVDGVTAINKVRSISNNVLLISPSSLTYKTIALLPLPTPSSGWTTLTVNGLGTKTILDAWIVSYEKWLLLLSDNKLYTAVKTPNTVILELAATAVQADVQSIHPLSGKLVVLKTTHAVLSTTDAATFATLTTVPTANTIVSFSVASTTNMAAALSDGTFYQYTGAWTNKTNDLAPKALNAIVVKDLSGNAYASGNDGEIYRRVAGTWTYQDHTSSIANFSDVSLPADNALRLSNGSDVYKFAAHAITKENSTSFTGTITKIDADASHQLAITNTGNIYANTGSSWVSSFAASKALYAVDATSNGDVAGGAAGSLYRGIGNAWNAAQPVHLPNLNAVAWGTSSFGIAVGTQGTIVTTADAANSWKIEFSGTTEDFTCVTAKGNNGVAGGNNGNLRYTSNKGASWAASTIPTTSQIKALSTGNGTTVLALAGSSVYKSLNGGATFTLDQSLSAAANNVCIDADGYGFVVGNAGMAYKITPNGNAFTYTAIATDANITDDKGTGIPVQNLSTVQFTDRLTGYITGVNGLVLKTVDGGLHWYTESTGGGTGAPLLSLADGENGSMINAGGTVSALRDRSLEFGTRNWYDQLGRLVLSQNAKQFNIEKYISAAEKADVSGAGTVRAYSYTLFDPIGRIVEVGEVLTRDEVPTTKHETQVNYATFEFSFVSGGVQREITKTYYDEVKFTNIQADFKQENLRPRVASVTYQDRAGVAYDRATHYSYDVHGNVKDLIQEISVNGVSLKKRMDYDYDLVSGKVNFMYYQKNQADQFIHKYEYDGDNRIVKVFTSRDAITWDRDAKYDYYAHGPLAKTTIGEHEVEKNTYAYTIQGWIKGVNGNSFSYALGYFNDGTHADYTGIGGASNYTLATDVATGKSLFNGNIATMASNTPQFANQGGAKWVQQFEYDQLNRITASSTLAGATANTFKTGYTYDAGGNITSLQRYDKAGVQFDAMNYNYENAATSTANTEKYKTNTNKLRWVDDDVNMTTVDSSDIDDQDEANYNYDEIGNLIFDKSEEIAQIEWTVYGKVKSVKRKAGSAKPDLEFAYDASGTRIAKTVKEKNGDMKITYYLHDASGNVISIYVSKNGSKNWGEQVEYSSICSCQRKYGSNN
ncbi:MAG: hypothetical protein NT150_07595 [Bacteroidetes bacterium]|nr:hypothetical protein [Bacteroidota bacterium]